MQLKINMRLARWTKKAPQNYEQNYANALTVFNGKLYAGTYESGLLFEWNDSDAWTLRASPIGTPPNDEYEICSLVVFNNKLYGGTKPHGKLVEWNGTNAWTEKAPQFGDEEVIYSLAVFNGKLYAGTYPHGKLLEWNGSDAWAEKAPQLGSEESVNALIVFEDKLYAGTYPHGKLYEWNGTDAWAEKAPQLGSETQIYSLVIFEDKLYGGGYATGKLLEWNGTDSWVEKAPQLGSETIRSLVVFNEKLFAGTYQHGKLYEWNGSNAWTEKARQLHDQIEILSLIVFNDQLYAGTAPDGMLFQLTWAARKTAKTEPDGKIYITPPNTVFDKSALDRYSIKFQNYNLKRSRLDDRLIPRELTLTVDRQTAIAKFSNIILAIDGIPVFSGFVEKETSFTREKRKYSCKGNEARLFDRVTPRKSFANSTIREILASDLAPSEYYPDAPGLLCAANWYVPPGLPWRIYDAAKNIIQLRFDETHLDFSGRRLFVLMNRGLHLLTSFSALADLQSNDLGYYISATKDIFIRVVGSNWYAVGGLFAEDLFDTNVRLGEQDLWWNRNLWGRLYLDHEEIASMFFSVARSNGYYVHIRDTFDHTYLDLKFSRGRGEGRGIITLNERDLLSFDRASASTPPAQCVITRGEGNQFYSVIDPAVRSGIFAQQSFSGTYRRLPGKLIGLASSSLQSRNKADVWKIGCSREKVLSLNESDFIKLRIDGEAEQILQIAQFDLSEEKASLQLGGRMQGFSDAWQSQEGLPLEGEFLLQTHPDQPVTVTMKPRDLDHPACAVGTAVLNVPADALGYGNLVILDLSASLSHPYAATKDMWRFEISVGGITGPWGIIDEVPLGESMSIDVTDIVAVGNNTVSIIALYYGKIETIHDTCVSGYRFPEYTWVPDSWFEGHPDLTASLTMKFFRMQ